MNNKLNTIFLCLSLCLIGCANLSESESNIKENNSSSSNTITVINEAQNLPISAKATMSNNEIIELEVAKTPEQQQIGLMFRESLPTNRGMLFSFSPPQITRFWMKNVTIPLDIIFMKEGSIVYIEHNTPPCTIDPCPVYGTNSPVDTVIELKNGKAKELNLKIGDKIKIEFLDNI